MTTACGTSRKLYLAGTTQKEMVLESIGELPEDATIEDIADRVHFLAAIQKGFDELDGGETIPHEEVKREIASWLKD